MQNKEVQKRIERNKIVDQKKNKWYRIYKELNEVI